jgi:hypothetical protein
MTLLDSAWVAQHRIEAWYRRPRAHKQSESTMPKVGADIILAVGLAMTALGFLFWYVWWIIGGVMLFWMGIMTLEDTKPDMPSEPSR